MKPDPALPGLMAAPAPPVSTLYWDFLVRHEKLLARNPRMTLQVKNLARMGQEERDALARRAVEIREECTGDAFNFLTIVKKR